MYLLLLWIFVLFNIVVVFFYLRCFLLDNNGLYLTNELKKCEACQEAGGHRIDSNNTIVLSVYGGQNRKVRLPGRPGEV